jgi:hypothetical protein
MHLGLDPLSSGKCRRALESVKQPGSWKEKMLVLTFFTMLSYPQNNFSLFLVSSFVSVKGHSVYKSS